MTPIEQLDAAIIATRWSVDSTFRKRHKPHLGLWAVLAPSKWRHGSIVATLGEAEELLATAPKGYRVVAL